MADAPVNKRAADPGDVSTDDRARNQERRLGLARLSDARAKYSGEVLGCGERSSMVVFNGAIWHGHTANVTPDSRRSIQGYFVRRSARSGFDFRNRPLPTARRRISPLARYLLALDDETQ